MMAATQRKSDTRAARLGAIADATVVSIERGLRAHGGHKFTSVERRSVWVSVLFELDKAL